MTHTSLGENLEPPDGIEPLDCPECDHPMEHIGGWDFECKWPPCDTNSIDCKEYYADLEDKVDELNSKLYRRAQLLRGLLKCIHYEQIRGSATFNAMVADLKIVLKVDEKKNGGR